METEIETSHYKAKYPLELKEEAERYIGDIEKVWGVMIDIFGKEPIINRYDVDFDYEGRLPTPLYLPNGVIKFRKSELENLLPSPKKDLTQGLTFETFHGFLEHVKHRPLGHPDGPDGKFYKGENKLGESFSTILKIELLDRIKLPNDADSYRQGEGMGLDHHRLLFLLVEIHKKYSIKLFQKLFRLLEESEKPIITEEMPKDKLCYYFSSCAKDDLSDIFEEHAYTIGSETKKRIKQLLLN